MRDSSRARGGYPGLGVVVLLGAVPALAQTTQPSTDEAASTRPVREPYDPRTSKTMTGDWGSVRSDLEDLGLRIELSYQQQFQQNIHGGLDTHNAHRFSGTVDYVFKLDFEKMGLIEGGSFYLKAKSGYSDGVNPDKVGAFGNVNSDAFQDESIFVRKWSYTQELLDGKVEFRIGRIQSMKDLVDVSLYANHEDLDFLNAHSIRNPTIPHANGIGAFLRLKPTDEIYIQAATIDAQVEDRTRTGFDTAFHDEAWFLGMWEMGYLPVWDTPKGPMPGSYRAGFWYDPRYKREFKHTPDGEPVDEFRGDDVGFYLGADQMVWKENDDPADTQGLGLFCRYGYAHRDINRVSDYWQAGASYKGLLPERNNDVFGFSVAQAILSSQYRHNVHAGADRETVYEWYYQIQLTPWCTISPDLQVVTNPGGDKDDRDAVVGGLRIRIIF